MSNSTINLADMRRRHLKDGLDETQVDENPFVQFAEWFSQAQTAELAEPNAMILATVNTDGQPTTRTVLLKYFDEMGFVFFTNYSSEKAGHIDKNPKVALQFLWLDLERQIKIEGTAEKISTAESIKYFTSRPKGSQAGVWFSHQSQIISSKDLLKAQYQKLMNRFKEGEVPFPDLWGGYRVVPNKIEFWQGGDNRLHDRIQYEKTSAENVW